MQQLYKLTIDGTSYILNDSGCTVSQEMNRMYDVATFTLDFEPRLELDVVIHYGGNTFNGFVFNTSKKGKNSWGIECRTYGAKLTEPYSPYDEIFDDATTSHDLCALYASESGIPITITSANLDFGGSYERKGTMLSALTNIANVTGAEFWDDGTGIQIQPNKAITTDGMEIPPSDIFDFVASKKTVYNKGIGFITIKNGGSDSDIISQNKIYAEVDECTGEIFVYPNPYGELELTKGMSVLSPVIVDRTETNSVIDKNIVRLNGAVNSVDSVTLNGVPITDYNFEAGHNVIYFTTGKRGTLTVNYKAKAFKGYTNIKQTPIGRFISFDIYYLDQVVLFEGILLANCGNNASTDGDMVCIVPSDTFYNQGFNVWTIGGDPEFLFFNKSTEIVRPVTSTADNYTSVESATLEEKENGSGWRYKTRYQIGSALGVQSAGEDISYTTSVDGDDYYFELSQYYPKVEVSYLTPAMKHTVQFAKITDGEITMVIMNNNTDKTCEYDLDTKIECGLNQNVPVDVAGELSLEVSDIRGASLPYLKPDNSSGTLTVDDFGKTKIYVFMDGDYVINTASLKLRSTITLTSKVNG